MSKNHFNPYARRRSRQLALQAIYAFELNHSDLGQLRLLIQQQPIFDKADQLYLNQLLDGILEALPNLDMIIKMYIDRDFTELNPVELSILRLSSYELLYQLNVPARVILNEAIELTKTFGSVEGHKFVNGILDKVAKQHRSEQMEKGNENS